jgi:hypothetical protein
MNKLVKKGIKSLKGIKKDAIIYAKDSYNEFAKPLVKSISKKIAKIDFNEIYEDSLKTADAAKVAGTAIIKTAQKAAMVKIKKARKFINKRIPLAKATVLGFATVNFVKAEKYINKTYPKIEKFVKVNYPNVKVWVADKLPKIEAFLAGQLSARAQKFAA